MTYVNSEIILYEGYKPCKKLKVNICIAKSQALNPTKNVCDGEGGYLPRKRSRNQNAFPRSLVTAVCLLGAAKDASHHV